MSDVPEARLRRSRGFALVWLVPLAALGLVVWLGVKTLVERGPLVTIRFDTAEGLEAGRTKVRHKAVDIGTVESVELSDDLSHAVVTARIDRQAASGLTDRASFWVVRPRLSAGEISGLSTIVSGAYLEFEPGRGGREQYEFKGLEEPPITQPDQPGREFVLHADRLGGLGQDTPVYHRGVAVGQVLNGQLNRKGDAVDVFVFVRAPYADLVKPRTQFWNTSGVSISLGPGGVKASLESLQALVAGGVEFDTGPDGEADPPSPARAEFKLFDDAASAQAEPWGARVFYQVEFPGPVHGLADGSPVELKGRYVGRVTEVHLAYDRAKDALATPAVLEIEPEHIEGLATEPGPDGAARSTNAFLAGLVAKGLRAHLGTANLLTGQRLIALDTDPSPTPASLRLDTPHPEIPAAEGGDLDSLTRSASRALDAIAAMPLGEIGAHLRDLTGHLDGLAGSPEARQSVRSLDAALASLNKLTTDADAQLPALIESLDETARAATRTFDAVSGEGGRGTDLRGLLHELQEAARSMRSLADMLQEHPEALVKGRSDEPK
jgi:paraquat-inducible protein B